MLESSGPNMNIRTPMTAESKKSTSQLYICFFAAPPTCFSSRRRIYHFACNKIIISGLTYCCFWCQDAVTLTAKTSYWRLAENRSHQWRNRWNFEYRPNFVSYSRLKPVDRSRFWHHAPTGTWHTPTSFTCARTSCDAHNSIRFWFLSWATEHILCVWHFRNQLSVDTFGPGVPIYCRYITVCRRKESRAVGRMDSCLCQIEIHIPFPE